MDTKCPLPIFYYQFGIAGHGNKFSLTIVLSLSIWKTPGRETPGRDLGCPLMTKGGSARLSVGSRHVRISFYAEHAFEVYQRHLRISFR